MNPVAVIGGGSWGTALAFLLAQKHQDVRLWVYEPELVGEINNSHENSMFLPGVTLPETIHASHSFEEVLKDCTAIVWVTPSHTIRDTLTIAKPWIPRNALFIGASKGIENGTLLRVSQIIDQIIGLESIHYVTLSGPTFASEVGRCMPSTAVVASHEEEIAKTAQLLFNTSWFRVYTNPDHIGVELGGALKNIIAIAVGITAGLKLGSNAKAALITRGLWEIARLGTALGANPLTFLGLSGMGDLVLTCDGTQSRNYLVGLRIGSGETLSSIQNSMRMIAEGVRTTLSAVELATNHNVEMPITEQVFEVLYHEKPPAQALRDLMSRSLKLEHQMNYMRFDENTCMKE